MMNRGTLKDFRTNRSCTRANDHSECLRKIPKGTLGPTKMIFAVKSMPSGTPCSSSNERPKQSPIGGDHGTIESEPITTIRRISSSVATDKSEWRARIGQGDCRNGSGQPKRAAIFQMIPGMKRINRASVSATFLAPPDARIAPRRAVNVKTADGRANRQPFEGH